MSAYTWICPHCQQPVTIKTEADVRKTELILDHDNQHNCDGKDYLCIPRFTVCPNPDCKKITFDVELHTTIFRAGNWIPTALVGQWKLMPSSRAKIFPDYIPKQILDDYREACEIQELSPKASATLARRCLQGMLRDYWGTKAGRLIEEIKQIENKIDNDTWQAIDAVRSVGNIGAHMEEDVNLIIDVEPNEAELLIGLIEILFKDWYVAREQKRRHLAGVIQLAKDKNMVKARLENNI